MDKNTHLIKDFLMVAASVVVAFLIIKYGIVEDLLSRTAGAKFLGSFIAGFFFTSVSTIIPSTVVLVKIIQSNQLINVAVIGAIGAVLGDLIIFRFIRDRLADDLVYILRLSGKEKWLAILHRRLFKRIIPLVGAIIVVSPLPDELGIAMMGLSRMKMLTFAPLAFVLNFIGILIIGLFAQGLG